MWHSWFLKMENILNVPDLISWALERNWPLPEGKLNRDSVWRRSSTARGDHIARYSVGLWELKLAPSWKPAHKWGPQSSNARNWLLPQPQEPEADPQASGEKIASKQPDFNGILSKESGQAWTSDPQELKTRSFLKPVKKWSLAT